MIVVLMFSNDRTISFQFSIKEFIFTSYKKKKLFSIISTSEVYIIESLVDVKVLMVKLW